MRSIVSSVKIKVVPLPEFFCAALKYLAKRVVGVVSPEDGDKKRRIRNSVTCAVILECGIIEISN